MWLSTQTIVRQQWQCQWRRRRRRRKCFKNIFENNFLAITLLAFAIFGIESAHSLRCYTDVTATKSRSVECGLNTGCVKIFIDSEELLLRRNQQYGYAYPTGEGPVPTLPEKYMDNPILLRGCFVLAVPDRCYTANNGLTYCWCSTKDLCNVGTRHQRPWSYLVFAAVFVVLIITNFQLCLTPPTSSAS